MERFGLSMGAVVAATVVVFAGCGSTSGVDGLFSGNAGGATAAPATATNGSAQSSGGPTSTSTGMASSTVASTGMTVGPGPTSTVASTAMASSSTGMDVPTVPCNGPNPMCSPGEVCCLGFFGQIGGCNQQGQCGDMFAELSCNEPEDCAPGEFCCGDLDQNNMIQPYKKVACDKNCDPQQQVIICTPGKTQCPGMTNCQMSMVLPAGYWVCR